MPWVGHWPGGRIWQDAKGRKTYVIKRRVDGRPYEKSTRCSSLSAAMKQYERFQADPEGYSPAGVQGDALILDAKLAKAFLDWSRDTKGNTRAWVSRQKAILAWWSKRVGRRDLRRVTLRDHIRPALDEVKNPRHHIEVIKAFYAWLREVRGLVPPAQDPTYGALPVPQARPEQWVRAKAIPRAHHDAVLGSITQPWRDMLIVLAGTGWHVTELERFARGGLIADIPASSVIANGAFKVIICPRRKSGGEQRTSVTREVAEAAGRVRARGTFSTVRLYLAVKSACSAAGVKPAFQPGQYRHTVATWAVEQGADPAAVAAFLGHTSPATTRRFYATLATVPKVPTLV